MQIKLHLRFQSTFRWGKTRGVLKFFFVFINKLFVLPVRGSIVHIHAFLYTRASLCQGLWKSLLHVSKITMTTTMLKKKKKGGKALFFHVVYIYLIYVFSCLCSSSKSTKVGESLFASPCVYAAARDFFCFSLLRLHL